MNPTVHLLRSDGDGFTLVELLIAIVVVSLLSTVAVVGIAGLMDHGEMAACTASADAARAATRLHYFNHGAYPATFTAMTAPIVELDLTGVTIDGSGLVVSTTEWTLTMTPGSPPSFACT